VTTTCSWQHGRHGIWPKIKCPMALKRLVGISPNFDTMYSPSTLIILKSHVTELFLISPLGGAKGFFSTPNFSETAGPRTRSRPHWTQVYSPYKPAKPGQDLWCSLGVRARERNFRKFWCNTFLEFNFSSKCARHWGFICPFRTKNLGKF